MGVRFKVLKEGKKGGRIGQLTKKARYPTKTPCYFPILNFMTGPPKEHGLYRNGGLFRWLKILLIKEKKRPIFLAQVLHFIDFGIHKKGRLEEWTSKTIHQWVKEKEEKYKPVLSMLDSGGFQFLNDCNDDLKQFLKNKMNIDVEKDDILDLQLKLGGDIIITFDLPLNPRLSYEESEERCKKSLNNAIRTLKRIKKLKNPPLVLLAVHGKTPALIKKYTQILFRRIEKNKLSNLNFGLCIGSMVPLTLPRFKDYLKIIKLVEAVKESIPKKFRRVMIHSLGMSGPIVPLLVYLGVDSFDGSSYIVSAQNRIYFYNNKRFNFKELKKLECDCKYCKLIGMMGLKKAQNILNGIEYGRIKELYEIDPRQEKEKERNDNKSAIYALIAAHNLANSLKQFNEMKKAIKKDKLLEWIFNKMPKDNELINCLGYLVHKHKKMENEFLKKFGRFPGDVKDKEFKLKEVTFKLNKNSFEIPEDYNPPKKEILLILPCTPEKPYSESNTHKRIKEILQDKWDKIHKVTLSGLYGPVPIEFEKKPPVLKYDYRLRSYSIFNPQKELVTQRLKDFLKKHGKNYKKIIAIAPKGVYRQVTERTFKKYGDGKVFDDVFGALKFISDI